MGAGVFLAVLLLVSLVAWRWQKRRQGRAESETSGNGIRRGSDHPEDMSHLVNNMTSSDGEFMTYKIHST